MAFFSYKGDPMKRLQKAVDARNIPAVAASCKKICNENIRDAVHIVAEKGDRYMVNALPKHWFFSSQSRDALHTAVENQNSETLDAFIRNGMDVNTTNVDGQTALHTVCYARHVNLSMLKMLLENFADLDIKDNRNLSPIGILRAKNDERALQAVERCGNVHNALVQIQKDVIQMQSTMADIPAIKEEVIEIKTMLQEFAELVDKIIDRVSEIVDETESESDDE